MRLQLLKSALCALGVLVPSSLCLATAQSSEKLFKASTDGFLEIAEETDLGGDLGDACMPVVRTAADFMKMPVAERDVGALFGELVGQMSDLALYDCSVFSTAMAIGLAGEDTEVFRKGLDLAFLVSGASVVAASNAGETEAEARSNYSLGYVLIGQGSLDDAVTYFCDAALAGQAQAFDVLDAWPTATDCGARRPAGGRQTNNLPPPQQQQPSPPPQQQVALPPEPEITAEAEPTCRTTSFEYYDGAGKLVTETSMVCDD